MRVSPVYRAIVGYTWSGELCCIVTSNGAVRVSPSGTVEESALSGDSVLGYPLSDGAI